MTPAVSGKPAPQSRRSWRVAMALAVGAVMGFASFTAIAAANARLGHGPYGKDFTYWWRAAQAVRAGMSPYDVVRDEGEYPFSGAFRYTLPAAVVNVPLAHLRADIGGAIFVAASFALLTFGLLTTGAWRLPILLSGPAIAVVGSAQWPALLIGATLVPWVGFLLACKPTLGAVLFLWRPDRRIFWGGILICLLCLLVQPTWPLDWLRAATAPTPDYAQYIVPLTSRGGALLLLALLRWRRPEARLLLLLACVPQNMFFYDQFPLLLVPQTPRSTLYYSAWTMLVHLMAIWIGHPSDGALWSAYWQPIILWGLYVPALGILLARPNEGPAPALFERWLSHRHVPAWLRGRAPEAA